MTGPRGRRREDAGYAAVLLALVVSVVVFPLAAISVDVARWYVEGARLQAAADAAALAGVTQMPDDLAAARVRALDAAADNGFGPATGTTVSVTAGTRPTQLRVTLTRSVPNAFAVALGVDATGISATALADFTGPAPMGSPCNALGNEPAGTTARGPVGSQIVAPAGASCSRTPQFWANVHGPNVVKAQGDQFATRFCAGGEDGCTGTTNDEFDPRGYFYVLRVGAAGVGHPVTVQLYDPAYVATGSRCTTAPSGNVDSNAWNRFTPDARTRYALTTGSGVSGSFCTGDDANSGLRVGSETPTVTSFGLRGPIDTQQPAVAPPITSCVRQYPGWSASAVTAGRLRNDTDPDLSSVFHHWVTMCTFTPTRAGDHYLQVRTNVALGGTAVGDGSRSGNQRVFSQSGDDPAVVGTGSNRFAIRAYSTVSGALSVSGWERMTIFANADSSSPVFNLVRVVPSSAGKVLDFSFFDAGEAATNGTLQLLPPTESTTAMGACTGVGKVTGPLAACRVTGISSAAGWNGRTQHIRVAIPAAYTCNVASPGGCWFRVQVGFGTGTVTDVTTWRAVVEGDPVRLVE